MQTVADYLRYCEKTLKECGIETYRSDCLFLIAYLQGVEPSLLILEEEKPFRQPERLKELLRKRCKERISVPHLIGEWDCLGETYKVYPKVLAPRAATELLIETVSGLIEDIFGTSNRLEGLEIGTGTGCISISLLKRFKNLNMVGVEVDPVAVKNTLENASIHNVLSRFQVVEGDIFKLCPSKILKTRQRKFDFIVSNPPYIAERDKPSLPPEVKNENPIALFGGEDGTLFHRFFAENCGEIINPDGFMALEFEPFQKEFLESFFKQKGWKVKFIEDFAGYPRVLIARRC